MFVDVQTDTHYAILSLLLLLANSPTNAQFQQPTADKFQGVVTRNKQKKVDFVHVPGFITSCHNARIASTVLATAFEMALCNRPYVTWLDGKGGPVNLQKGHSKQYISLTTDVLLLIVFTYVIPQAQLVHICLALIFITALFSNWSFLQYFPKKLITVKFNSWISFQWLCHFYGIKKIYSMHFKSRHC